MACRFYASLLVAGPLLLAVAASAHAQRAELELSRGPYYVGVPIQIEVRAWGFDEDSAPNCTWPQPEKGTLLDLGAAEPIVSQSIHVTRSGSTEKREVTLRHAFQFVCETPGRYRLGPFTMTQGGKTAKTKSIQVQLETVAITNDMKIRVVVPERPLFVGERVSVQLEWWLLDSELENFSQFAPDFLIPLFEQADLCTFIDREVEPDEQCLQLLSGGRPKKLPVKIEKRTDGARNYVVIIAQRVLVPLKAGEHTLREASITVDRVTEWRRGSLGQRPTRVQKMRALDLARRLVFKDVPLAGRPQSFTGAVGHGFTLEAAADRTVVQVGDPITLTLTLRGEGGLERCGPPLLTADGGLSPTYFRIPGPEESAGILQENGSKVFTASIRVLSDAVREIPALAYSWFDTEKGEYETTRSHPIALSVRTGTTVSAGDVESSVPRADSVAKQNGVQRGVDVDDAAQADGIAPRTIFTLSGADLSIVKGGAVLAGEPSRRGGTAACAALYGASFAALGIALFSRRRAAIDPARLRRRKLLKVRLKEIEQCRGGTRREAMERIASALRAMLAEMPAARTADCDRVIAECENVLYAPKGDREPPLDAAFHARAVLCARAIRSRGAA